MSGQRLARCGYTIIEPSGMEAPCDRPASGWCLYQDGDLIQGLHPACDLHVNETGTQLRQAQVLRDAMTALHSPTAGSAIHPNGHPSNQVCRECRDEHGAPAAFPCASAILLLAEPAAPTHAA